FLARVYQAQAECADERDDRAAYAQWMYKMYTEFPQLVPYTGLRMPMQLHVTGEGGAVVSRLKDCNINWVNDPSAPQVYVSVLRNGKNSRVTYSVRTATNIIVPETSFGFDGTSPLAENEGVNLAYRLFKIGETPVSKTET
ncbi:MAG TPA: hypothetical protein VIN07_10025, partial [Flavipsychrobacter sp.]